MHRLVCHWTKADAAKRQPLPPTVTALGRHSSRTSIARCQQARLSRDEAASSGQRTVDTWLPIHDWTETQLWQRIRASSVPYHPAYDQGMTRHIDRTTERHADWVVLVVEVWSVDLAHIREKGVAGLFDEVSREVGSIRLSRWGRVVAADGEVPWLLVDPDGVPVAPVATFLLDFGGQGYSAHSVRSYAYVLLRWWRWLRAVEVEWNRATPAEARDLVLWLKQAKKPRAARRTTSLATAGTINPITRKKHLGDRYEARTICHNNAVIRSFYLFWCERPDGPLINPVQLDRRHAARRPNAHHNPLETFRPEGKIRYNPKVPKRQPREMPDGQWTALFGGLRSNRDRAILAMAISNGARASELLRVRGVDVDWGDQLVRVTRKGSGDEQWLPVSREAFVWLRLYLADLGAPLALDELLWWTLRRRDRGDGLRPQPMNYEALRAVFRRVNALLGTNWTMHDLRHTASLRMSRDENLSLKDVQVILGHAHLSTTADIYTVEDLAHVVRRVHRHLAEREQRAAQAPPPVAVGYEAADLAVLLGGVL